MALDPSETVILIEATYQAKKPPKDRIMRVPVRISPIPTIMGKLVSSSTALIMTSSSQ